MQVTSSKICKFSCITDSIPPASQPSICFHRLACHFQSVVRSASIPNRCSFFAAANSANPWLWSWCRSESGWCSDVTSTHGAWRHAGVRFLLSGVFRRAPSRFQIFALATLSPAISGAIRKESVHQHSMLPVHQHFMLPRAALRTLPSCCSRRASISSTESRSW